MINVPDMRKLLAAATKCEILIVTETSDEAEAIRREFREFVDWHLSRFIPVWTYSDRVVIGGYYDIYVTTFEAWNGSKRYKPFSGAVLVTGKRLLRAKNIAEGVP